MWPRVRGRGKKGAYPANSSPFHRPPGSPAVRDVPEPRSSKSPLLTYPLLFPLILRPRNPSFLHGLTA